MNKTIFQKPISKFAEDNFRRGLSRACIFLGAVLFPSVALAQFNVGNAPAGLTSDKLADIVSNVILGILEIAALLGIVYLVYGGIRYVTSAGNESDAEDAKNIITYAIWGLFLIAAAFAIVKTIVGIVG